MYGMIKNGELVLAPRVLYYPHVTICNPTEDRLIDAGYKPIVFVDPPSEGLDVVFSWVDTGYSILQVWGTN